MWNVPAGLFNWLVPGTGLMPSLHLNFGTEGASGSSFRNVNHLNLPPWKRKATQRARNLSEFLGAFAELRKATLMFATSVVPPARNSSTPTGRILMKFDTYVFRKSVKKIQVSLKSDKNNSYFT